MQAVQHFQLAGVDLNLLVVFDALMSEQHLTRAAEKIGLSQPATSNALARLRKLFKDDLFIKTSRGITPTPRAFELTEPIRQALEQIQFVVSSQPEFNPATSDRTFRIGMDDYTEIVFLPKLFQTIEELAPHIKIQIRSSNWQKAPKLLDANEIDLAIGYCPQYQTWHQRQILYEERFVCVTNAKQFKKRKAITLDEYITASHLLVSPKEDMVGMVDEILQEHNLQRTVALSVPNFLIVPFVLCNTDLIATLPTQIVQTFVEVWKLHALPLPFEMLGFSVDLLWHTKSDRDPAHRWLRNLIAQLCPE
ncbi:LysR family transcriptional regulator [Chlorogloeopsis fritschii PCC 9212]|uniref:LysR family transcriptional regulator n=1 Tax=Chlorogloeopsis fritschii PCC 6912 TaxID=211165 RepID=A0A433NP09_CHLFR|nr:LysR family transcriptional regulator [Chlorogloeopsis fritschii]RUR85086.1 LysR family transcriptional regulator [Chlorogloeopsis fritschii PCC 6912]